MKHEAEAMTMHAAIDVLRKHQRLCLHTFARTSIRQHVRLFGLSEDRAFRDVRIAAWLVWSMRGTPLAKEDFKSFNRARRVMQRAGRVKV